MSFLLRSAFWLGLVFSHMDWPSDGLAAALPAVIHTGSQVAAKACSARPSDCLAVAGALVHAR